jgi:hypothetical protein
MNVVNIFLQGAELMFGRAKTQECHRDEKSVGFFGL